MQNTYSIYIPCIRDLIDDGGHLQFKEAIYYKILYIGQTKYTYDIEVLTIKNEQGEKHVINKDGWLSGFDITKSISTQAITASKLLLKEHKLLCIKNVVMNEFSIADGEQAFTAGSVYNIEAINTYAWNELPGLALLNDQDREHGVDAYLGGCLDHFELILGNYDFIDKKDPIVEKSFIKQKTLSSSYTLLALYATVNIHGFITIANKHQLSDYVHQILPSNGVDTTAILKIPVDDVALVIAVIKSISILRLLHEC